MRRARVDRLARQRADERFVPVADVTDDHEIGPVAYGVIARRDIAARHHREGIAARSAALDRGADGGDLGQRGQRMAQHDAVRVSPVPAIGIGPERGDGRLPSRGERRRQESIPRGCSFGTEAGIGVGQHRQHRPRIDGCDEVARCIRHDRGEKGLAERDPDHLEQGSRRAVGPQTAVPVAE
ncbi:hypothetical protein WR25_17264 [Diploscapter pachys]|uniref:Uncharacterized protein n=1 Tax=Diploscapter pachys TaxID=2018661 RepID=A0A2A2K100_9BILA|nr:hypothetical protein WR25_17264 [Diploscapter pachys]